MKYRYLFDADGYEPMVNYGHIIKWFHHEDDYDISSMIEFDKLKLSHFLECSEEEAVKIAETVFKSIYRMKHENIPHNRKK